MRSLFFPARASEATAEQLAATGSLASGGYDPIDGDVGFQHVGDQSRSVPRWNLEKARSYSVAAYRANPMARAIIDTYVAFCVGDSGLTLQCSSPEVRPIAEGFWNDPANEVAAGQELQLRSHLLMGESLNEMMVGKLSGVVRRSPIDPARVKAVELLGGNPLWPEAVTLRTPGSDDKRLTIARPDDMTGLRQGDALWWVSFRALETDTRGFPFMGPILDWLDSYDTVLSNLIDRTAIARHIAFDVTLKGDKIGDTDIDEFVRARGGKHIPRSGTIEVHNEGVEWKPLTAEAGSMEDANTSRSILTLIAGGAGLAKTWLAEPEDSNRATSITMAEPVRRRVGGVQNVWLARQTDWVRFAVDQAVLAGRIPPMVEIPGPAGAVTEVRAADTVTVTGPQIAVSDAKISAEVLHKLSLAIKELQASGVLTDDAAQMAVRKGWEDYMGVPYAPELDTEDADTDAIADRVEDAGGGTPALQALPA